MLTILKHRRKSFRAAAGGTSPGTANLLAWYEMNDASGGAVDSHSGSYDLTENGTPLYAQTGVNGNAIDFDGSTDYFSLASTFGWSEAYPFSFSAHFKTSSASNQTISQITAPGAQGKYVLMNVQADGEVSAYVRAGTIQSITSSGAGVGDGAWHHLVATFVSATERYLYLDGVQVAGSASETSQAIDTDMSEIRVGADQSNGISNYFNGLLDDVAFWSDELTLNEITWLYNSGSGRSYSAVAAADYRSTVLADSPLFYYRLGESSGSTAYDEVAASSNGTYYNTPTLAQAGNISGDTDTSVLFEQANNEYAETLTLSSETSLLPCTIECFIKVSGASDDNAGIVFYRTVNTTASGLNIRGTTLGKLGYHWNGASSTYGYTGGPTLSDNTWYYVALVVESTKATFYVIEEDGTLTTAVNTLSHSALDCSGDGWQIASDPYGSRYFQGYLDEVAIYDQALSQSTLVAHAAAAGYTS